ncbi:stress-responsive transcription factor hsf1 [Pichia californica]|uniref:Heat shock transcription factor n=1 Tax=Pichia californica TaxID=460514 RepID=A0A9P6WII2_9ASCO|nr:stress-responsive transcription factor hsf1 [[Candida] californica]KAG0687566.1 stress-responsive transcription factor hsf1 [[Candida] californica]
MENQSSNPQTNLENNSFSNISDSNPNPNLDVIDNEITDVPLFMKNTDSSVSALNTPLNNNDNNNDNNTNTNTAAPDVTQTPIIVSPDTENTPNMQSLSPLNPDKNVNSSNNLDETYTLSNYYKNDNNDNNDNSKYNNTTNIQNINIKKEDLLDIIDNENGKITEEIANQELQPSNSLTFSTNKTISKKKIQSTIPPKRPAFVVKLWKMVNDPSNDHYICWMDKGDAFQVKDRESFMKYVLPKYFKHNNLASFIRQLNMYGWHKVQDVNSGALVLNEEILQFENPNFIRGREDLLDKIIRNKPTKENDDDDIDFKQLMNQLEQMKRNQLLISEDLKRVRQDNELLWKENFIARERHKIQSETLDKIMRFLASIYGNNTTRLIEKMTTPGDLVELNENQPTGTNNNNQNYHDDYGYYVSTGSTPLNSNNNMGNVNNNLSSININSISDSPTINNPNNMMETTSNTQQLDFYNPNQIQQKQQQSQNYNISAGNKQPQQNSLVRRQLMITNKSHENPNFSRSNEIRMSSVGYIPTHGEDVDSSIQEIRRGPESFNTTYMDTSRLQPQQQQQQQLQQQYSNINNNVTDSSNSNYPGYRTSNKNLVNIDTAPFTTVGDIPVEQYNSPKEIANLNVSSPVENKDHQQIMGNIQQQLHKHQGTLKQVHDWLNKYNDHIDTDNISISDDFKVDDFLQQPLELTGDSGTPVDFNNVDAFINTDTPIQTPIMAHSQLNSINTNNLDFDINDNNKKRPYNQDNTNDDSTDLSSKRFKNA